MSRQEETLIARLSRKIASIETDRWGAREAPVVRLGEDVRQDPETGRLAGTLEVLIRTRDGGLAPCHAASLDGIATAEELDDRLAEALSRVLAGHADWPR